MEPAGDVDIVPKLSADPNLREIGGLAVWSVTSAKPGNGVEMLRDGREDTYWQSDGLQPHLININFQKKVTITQLAMYMDYKLDESYTPNKLAIRVGSTFTDLKDIKEVELQEPSGWVVVPLHGPEERPMLKAYFLQIAVLTNHQNGRDSHMRQIRVFGPREDPAQALGYPLGFSTVEFSSYATIR